MGVITQGYGASGKVITQGYHPEAMPPSNNDLVIAVVSVSGDNATPSGGIG